MRFTRLIFADYGERYLAWFDVLQNFAAGNQLAVGRKNRGNANDVARGNARIAQRQLKAGKALAVFPDSLGEENFLCDERHEQYRTAVPPQKQVEKTSAGKLTSTRRDVNGIHRACGNLASQSCWRRDKYYSLMKTERATRTVFARVLRKKQIPPARTACGMAS